MRVPHAAEEVEKLHATHHVVRTLLDQLATAPHRQLRCEIAICLDALVEMSPRIATQMIELGGTIALADALCDALWSNQLVLRAHYARPMRDFHQ